MPVLVSGSIVMGPIILAIAPILEAWPIAKPVLPLALGAIAVRTISRTAIIETPV